MFAINFFDDRPLIFTPNKSQKSDNNLNHVCCCFVTCKMYRKPLDSSYQLLLNIDRVHMIIDEMISDGQIVESSQSRILAPMHVLDRTVAK